MLNILPDDEIDALIREHKIVPPGLSAKPKMVERSGHFRKDFQVASASETGNEFVLALRQSAKNATDFSAILGYKVPGMTTTFLLRRYNGNSHIHTNSIEHTRVRGCHVHTATERYQKIGGKVEGFAEITDRYINLQGAVQCLLQDCGFEMPPPSAQFEFEFGPNTI